MAQLFPPSTCGLIPRPYKKNLKALSDTGVPWQALIPVREGCDLNLSPQVFTGGGGVKHCSPNSNLQTTLNFTAYLELLHSPSHED